MRSVTDEKYSKYAPSIYIYYVEYKDREACEYTPQLLTVNYLQTSHNNGTIALVL